MNDEAVQRGRRGGRKAAGFFETDTGQQADRQEDDISHELVFLSRLDIWRVWA